MSALDPVWTHPVTGATLWVGSRHFTPDQLEAAAISLVVSAAEPPGFLAGWAAEPGRDHHAFIFRDVAELPDARDERIAVARIAEALESGRNTLVHCQGGLNRSAYLAARALVALGLEPVAAVERLRQRRDPRALGNSTFLGALVPRHERERLSRASRVFRGRRHR